MKSAEQGNTKGMLGLSSCYRLGLGVDKDVVREFEWKLKAAEAGNVSAYYSVAACFSRGIGTKIDQAKYL